MIHQGLQLWRNSSLFFGLEHVIISCVCVCGRPAYLLDVGLQLLIEVPEVPHDQLVLRAHHDPLHVDLVSQQLVFFSQVLTFLQGRNRFIVCHSDPTVPLTDKLWVFFSPLRNDNYCCCFDYAMWQHLSLRAPSTCTFHLLPS